MIALFNNRELIAPLAVVVAGLIVIVLARFIGREVL